MARIYDYNKNEWVTVNTASDIAIRDLSESFGGAVNVEEALQHVAKDITEGQNDIADCKKSLEEHSEWIDWLKVNGGGGGGGTGGGSSAPIISSTLTESSFIVDKGTSVILPIYFQSPNLGDGVLIVAIDGAEVDSFSIKQGNNNVNIGELPNLSNRVSVYAKDRTGKLSNQLDWTIICGGIDLTLDFDYNVDYTVGSTIYMPFNIYSPTDEPVVLNIDIAGEKRQMQCNQGYNEYVFRDLGVGVHTITIQATDGTYSSQAITFNLVIVDSDSLYLSTTFENGCDIELGLPIVIDYRISNPNDEYMTVNQYLDGELYKTLSARRGAYSWTLNGLTDIKEYTYKIEVIASNGTREVEGTFNVVKGAYTPVQVNTQGLAYRLYAGERTNQDLDRQNPVYEGISATLHDFNFSSNGWIDGVLRCNGGSYVEIDYSPWSDNAPNGCTIEIDFKVTNVGDIEAKVLDYTDSATNKGLFIALEEAKINSISNEGKVFVNADEWTTISFVIDRKSKFAKIFINGVCTRAFKLSDSGNGVNAILEDFAFDGKMYLNCTKELTNAGECDIKDLRVYRRPLTDDEIVKNVIAQETDLQKQKELYDFNFNNTSLPVMRMYGDTSNMTLETPVPMRIKYSSPNTEKYGQPFDLPYCQVNWQGTSSLDYVLKNYNIVLKDANMADAYYSPFPNGVPENIFCLKADYMESSHSRNVGIAKFVEACLYSTKNPAQVKNPNVRNSVEGFPILLYINDELQGVYNFNTDRRSTNTFGYTDENNHLVYEISANSDTTAGAFIKWSSDTGKSEIDYYKSDFSCIYPPTRVAGNDNFAEIKRLVEWVDNASDEDFRDNLDQYFNREYLIRYYIFVMIFGAVDSLGKNMKLASWDGRIWYPQVYDCDTTIGLDNTGFLKFDSDIEIGDEGVFNTTSSKLWSKVKLLLDDEIKAQYSLIRQNKFTLDNLFKYIVEEQMDKIPATFYNKDMQTKYLNWGSSYLYALHGRGKQQIKTWLTERLLYIDTLMEYNVSTSDYVTIRSSKLGEVYLDIQTFNSMYLNVKWRNTADNSSTQRLKIKKGETVRFSFNMPTATDQEIRVYGGKYIKSLGDLSNLQPTTLLLAKAPGVTELVCHSTNLINTDLSECTSLKRVDLSGCTQLGSGVGAQSTVDVSKCTNIEYVNCQNTQITGVLLNPLGSNIKEIWYPKSIQAITLSECPSLRIVGLEPGHSCKALTLINCPEVEAFGDLNYSPAYNKNQEQNIKYLAGLQSIYLDNSFDRRCLQLTGNVNSITLKNMKNVEEIQLLCGTYSTLPSVYTDIETLGSNLTINTKGTKVKSLNFIQKHNKGFYYEDDYRVTNPISSGSYGSECIVYNKIDLSNTEMETFEINVPLWTNFIKLPNTLKKFNIHSYYSIREEFYDNYSNSQRNGINAYIEEAINNFQFVGQNANYVKGYFISNIYTSETEEVPTKPSDFIWDFTGLKLTDFCITPKLNQKYINTTILPDLKIKYRNIDVQPTIDTPNFRFVDEENSYNVTLDYSKYVGYPVMLFKNTRYDFITIKSLLKDNYWTEIVPNLPRIDKEDFFVEVCYNSGYTINGQEHQIIQEVFKNSKSINNINNNFRYCFIRNNTKENPIPKLTNSYITSTGNTPLLIDCGCNFKYYEEIELPNLVTASYLFTKVCLAYNAGEDSLLKSLKVENILPGFRFTQSVINKVTIPQATNLSCAFGSDNQNEKTAVVVVEEIECADTISNAFALFGNMSRFDSSTQVPSEIRFTNPIRIQGSAERIFYKSAIPVRSGDIDWVGVTNVTSAFEQCYFTEANMKNFGDNALVTSMTKTFYSSSVANITGVEVIPVNVTSLDNTFASCSRLTTLLKFAENHNVISLNDTFNGTKNLVGELNYKAPSDVSCYIGQSAFSNTGFTKLNVDLKPCTYLTTSNLFSMGTNPNLTEVHFKFPRYWYVHSYGNNPAHTGIEMRNNPNLLWVDYDMSLLENCRVTDEWVFNNSATTTKGFKYTGIDTTKTGFNIKWYSDIYVTELDVVNVITHNVSLVTAFSKYSYECQLEVANSLGVVTDGQTITFANSSGYDYEHNTRINLTDEQKANLTNIAVAKGWTVAFG